MTQSQPNYWVSPVNYNPTLCHAITTAIHHTSYTSPHSSHHSILILTATSHVPSSIANHTLTLTPHPSPITYPHPSPITLHIPSPFIHHPSPFTLTHHPSPFTLAAFTHHPSISPSPITYHPQHVTHTHSTHPHPSPLTHTLSHLPHPTHLCLCLVSSHQTLLQSRSGSINDLVGSGVMTTGHLGYLGDKAQDSIAQHCYLGDKAQESIAQHCYLGDKA